MNRDRLFLKGIVALTIGSCLAPPAHALASDPLPIASREARPHRDVALAKGGVFRGQLVDPAGIVLQQAPVSLYRNGQEVCSFSTDAQGMFAIDGLNGGSYELVSGATRQPLRLWAPGSAPPTAVASVLVVREGHMVRGQTTTGGGLTSSTIWTLGAAGLIVGGTYAILQSDSGS